MTDEERKLCDQLVAWERERLGDVVVPPRDIERPTLHYTELPESRPGPLAAEWNFYRREAGRLLADGHEGRWAVIKDECVVGIWDTLEEVERVRREQFPAQPVLLKQILTREPLLRSGWRLQRWLQASSVPLS